VNASRQCSGLVQRAIMLAACGALLMALSGALSAEPTAPDYFVADPAPNDNGTHISLRWPRVPSTGAGLEYVIYVGRGPARQRFQCARVPSGSGFITDDGVAPYYPYRFSKGDEHIAIVDPLAHLKYYWLEAETRYARWISQANGNLQDCEQDLLTIRRNVRKLRRQQFALDHYRPIWSAEMDGAKARYIKEAGLNVAAADIDLSRLWTELIEKRNALQQMSKDAGALSEEEREQLDQLNAHLAILAPAHRCSEWLRDSEAKLKAIQTALAGNRESYLQSAASFACIYHLVQSESRTQLAAVLEVEPGEVTPELVAKSLEGLEARLAASQERADAAQADSVALDEFDRLRYCCYLARMFTERAEKKISLESIETDLLYMLDKEFKGVPLPEAAAAEAPQPPDVQQLLAAVEAECEAGLKAATDSSPEALAEWTTGVGNLDSASAGWKAAKAAALHARLRQAGLPEPQQAFARSERTRITVLAAAADKRLKQVRKDHAVRTYHFRLAAVPGKGQPEVLFAPAASAAARPALYDAAKTVNLAFAVFFTAAVLFTIAYVRRHPDVFVRPIAGLEAIDEAIGRATEMGKPALFVHGLSGVSDIAVLASLSILGRIARRIAEYDSDLLVVNNGPIVYAVSYEVVQEGYTEAGRPDAFNPDNVFLAASEQFPYVAAVAGIMKRRQPAANFFMGYFYAESLILAEVGATTGAIQIAATDSFLQIPFFITTCDYTLMGEELYAAGAYLSHNAKMLATLKAQDMGKAILLVALPAGTVLSNVGVNWIDVLFSAYEKGF